MFSKLMSKLRLEAEKSSEAQFVCRALNADIIQQNEIDWEAYSKFEDKASGENLRSKIQMAGVHLSGLFIFIRWLMGMGGFIGFWLMIFCGETEQ